MFLIFQRGTISFAIPSEQTDTPFGARIIPCGSLQRAYIQYVEMCKLAGLSAKLFKFRKHFYFFASC